MLKDFINRFPVQPVSDEKLAQQVLRNAKARKLGWSSWGVAAGVVGFSALPGGVTLPLGLLLGGAIVVGGRVNEYLSNRKTVRAAEGNESYLSRKVRAAHRLRVAKGVEGVVGVVSTGVAALPGGAPGVPVALGFGGAFVGLRIAEGAQNIAAAHEAREILGINKRRREKIGRRSSSAQ
ncbi:MAG TPA: hypothetical protein VN711_03940 [Candidatus Saccharimonadales bacterium]|nr:hypothetical protein [Candidatus Saccharimonadales bacterium]